MSRKSGGPRAGQCGGALERETGQYKEDNSMIDQMVVFDAAHDDRTVALASGSTGVARSNRGTGGDGRRRHRASDEQTKTAKESVTYL